MIRMSTTFRRTIQRSGTEITRAISSRLSDNEYADESDVVGLEEEFASQKKVFV